MAPCTDSIPTKKNTSALQYKATINATISENKFTATAQEQPVLVLTQLKTFNFKLILEILTVPISFFLISSFSFLSSPFPLLYFLSFNPSFSLLLSRLSDLFPTLLYVISSNSIVFPVANEVQIIVYTTNNFPIRAHDIKKQFK